jgi:hypothetical protein
MKSATFRLTNCVISLYFLVCYIKSIPKVRIAMKVADKTTGRLVKIYTSRATNYSGSSYKRNIVLVLKKVSREFASLYTVLMIFPIYFPSPRNSAISTAYSWC